MSGCASFALRAFGALGITLLAAAPVARADNWADHVISYDPGQNPVSGYTDPATSLGEPTRFTGVGVFPGAVTPFNPAYMPTEIVSIGVGGSLVVKFDQPITNDLAHPYGMDLLIFGNSGYNAINYPQGVTDGSLFGAGHGRIEVSADGSQWTLINSVQADGAFPTLGYSDMTDPYSPNPGSVLSDFTRPVNPTFTATSGTTFAQIVAAYAGSGGGTGVDIGEVGLSSISYVRITNPNSTGTVEIDAFSRVAVPGPGTGVAMLAVSILVGSRRRRC